MHELITVLKLTENLISLAVRMPAAAARILNLLVVDHTPRCRLTAAARTRHCNGDVPPGYDEEQTSSLASLEAWWPAEQASRNAQRFAPFVQELDASLWPPLFVYTASQF